jgi:hypothetical protein
MGVGRESWEHIPTERQASQADPVHVGVSIALLAGLPAVFTPSS